MITLLNFVSMAKIDEVKTYLFSNVFLFDLIMEQLQLLLIALIYLLNANHTLSDIQLQYS